MTNRFSMENLLVKAKPNRVVFHGQHAKKLMDKCFSGTLSFETQQQDEDLAEDIILNVYVIKPKQMGISEAAQFVADATKSPDSTLVTILPDEEGEEPLTEDEKLTVEKVEQIVKNTGAQVFHDIDASAEYINQMGEGTLTSE